MRAARWFLLAAIAALTALAPAASAKGDGVDAATKAAARAAAEDALARYDAGDYAAALALFNRADALVHAPTLGLMAARSLEKLGRLVEASERYLAVTRVKLAPGAPDAQAKAQVTAERERAGLQPKVPAIVIAIEGGAASEAVITLDGNPVEAALVGLKRPTDPGPHRLEARRGKELASRDFVLKLGEVTTITLRLTGAVPVAEGAAPRVDGKAAEDSGATDPAGAANGMSRAGWAGVGIASLGGAGLVVGAITGGLAISAKHSLDAAGCVGGHCPASQQSTVDRYDTLRLASGGTLIAGGILAAGGVAVVLATRARAPSTTAYVTPWLGLGRAGVGGSF
jgi:hypothetical protein